MDTTGDSAQVGRGAIESDRIGKPASPLGLFTSFAMMSIRRRGVN